MPLKIETQVYENIKFIDFPQFTSVQFINDIYAGVARVQRSTGALQINLYVWDKMPPEHKFFVLCHEAGHIALNTSNEIEVDNWAFKKYANAGLSLKESVKALTQYLNTHSTAHKQRAFLQYQRALQFDKKFYK
jgi:hypothetical protein